MGFGSYDETGQDTREIDETDEIDTNENDHEGDVEYEIGASNDELIDRLEEIKQKEAS
jgi:hypothetical protein